MNSLTKFCARYTVLLGCIFLVSVVGCSRGPKLYDCSGTLTHNGTPLPNMVVYFVPSDGQRQSSGQTDASGRFTLWFTSSKEGVFGGEHTVYVVYRPTGTDQLLAQQEGTLELAADVQAVLDKYGDPETSPCRVTIDSDADDLEVKLD